MTVVIVVCIAVVLLILGLSLLTINKGYAYKQTVDPLPDEEDSNQTEQEKHLT